MPEVQVLLTLTGNSGIDNGTAGLARELMQYLPSFVAGTLRTTIHTRQKPYTTGEIQCRLHPTHPAGIHVHPIEVRLRLNSYSIQSAVNTRERVALQLYEVFKRWLDAKSTKDELGDDIAQALCRAIAVTVELGDNAIRLTPKPDGRGIQRLY